MVFYTADDDVTEAFHTAPKRTRQIFCFNQGILLQSRLYPQTDDEETRELYRSIVQHAIAYCMKVPNLWNLKREQEAVDDQVTTHEDALHYRDYEYKCYKANVSLLKSENVGEDDSILAGDTAYCIDCSEPIRENNTLYCDSCNDGGYVRCYECHRQVEEDDAHYIDGNYYCDNCCSCCEDCNEYKTDETTEVYDRRGYSRYVCPNCLKKYYCYCEDYESYFEEDNGHHLDDGFCCNDCSVANYCVCEHCGKYVQNDDAEEIDDNNYCSDCADDIRTEREENQESADYPVSA